MYQENFATSEHSICVVHHADVSTIMRDIKPRRRKAVVVVLVLCVCAAMLRSTCDFVSTVEVVSVPHINANTSSTPTMSFSALIATEFAKLSF